jgi:hypothetical protein
VLEASVLLLQEAIAIQRDVSRDDGGFDCLLNELAKSLKRRPLFSPLFFGESGKCIVKIEIIDDTGRNGM